LHSISSIFVAFLLPALSETEPANQRKPFRMRRTFIGFQGDWRELDCESHAALAATCCHKFCDQFQAVIQRKFANFLNDRDKKNEESCLGRTSRAVPQKETADGIGFS
jgi:hypothetical protein